MPAELQRVKRRITGISKIRKLTGAMQQVASARLQNDRRAMLSSNAYTARLMDVLREACLAVPDFRHPLLEKRRAEKVGITVFSSDRGLCGGFNTQLMEALHSFIDSRPDSSVKLLVMGKVAARRARRSGMAVTETLGQPDREKRLTDIQRLAQRIAEDFTFHRLDKVFVLYVRDINGQEQSAVFEQLLPVPLEFPAGHRPKLAAALFEPDAESLLEHLLGQYVAQMLDHAFLNSLAAENAARRTAMTRASDNAAETLGELEQQHSRLRQGGITAEMLEISAHA